MRFTSKRPPANGDVRFKHRFLWFPKGIGREWRWLEIAGWREGYFRDGYSSSGWRAVEWLRDV